MGLGAVFWRSGGIFRRRDMISRSCSETPASGSVSFVFMSASYHTHQQSRKIDSMRWIRWVTHQCASGDFFVMGRNPFWPILERTPEPNLRFGQLEFRGKRPELEALVGECLMAWPQVDAELGLFFGQLAMPSAPMIAVFQALRRSSNQREAIATAADITLKDGRRSASSLRSFGRS